MTTQTIKRKGNAVKVIAGSDYSPHVRWRALANVTNTGNGYIAKFKSFSSARQDNYVCLDYAEAHYLWLALGEFFKDGE